jgi:hypothetical protein
MSGGALPIVALIILVAALAVAWSVTARVKQRVDGDKPVAVPSRRTVQVTTACVERLRVLSQEPVLLKFDDGMLRFQIDDRPMLPAAVAPNGAAAALREVGTVLIREFGAHWIAVVQPAAEDALIVDRLA